MSSDEAYDAADGDVISRYLLHSPRQQEPHPLATVRAPAEATHHVVAPHHAPPVHQVEAATGGLRAAQPLLPMSPAPATGLEHHHALAMDVQPPQTMLAPAQAYGLPDDPAPVVPAVGPDAELLLQSFDSRPPPAAGSPSSSSSLHDHFMDDGGEDAVIAALMAELQVCPVEEDPTFVPFVPGQLDCTRCRTVRELLHQSANHRLYFTVHVAEPGTAFQHAIIDRTYMGADGEATLNEMMYLDLRQRTHEWVQNFIASSVETLRNDKSGQLEDSWSTFCPPDGRTNIRASQANTHAHIQLEMDMLNKILSAAPAANAEAVAPEHTPGIDQPVTQEEVNAMADDIFNTASGGPGFSPALLESSSQQVSVQGGECSASASDYQSRLAKRRHRISKLSMGDMINLLHMSRKDAAKELNISATSLKRLCGMNCTDRWPARRIVSLDNKIKKLEEAALKIVGTTGLFSIREKLDKLKFEKAQIYAAVMKGIQEKNDKHGDGGAAPSGK